MIYEMENKKYNETSCAEKYLPSETDVFPEMVLTKFEKENKQAIKDWELPTIFSIQNIYIPTQVLWA